MILLPNLAQITPDLIAIMIESKKEQEQVPACKSARFYLSVALGLYDPKDLFNSYTLGKFDEILARLQRRLDNTSLNPANNPKVEFDLGLCKAYIAALFFYQGNWRMAVSTIQEALLIAEKSIKEEKSIAHLYFLAACKALYGRILYSQEEFDQGIKMLLSSLDLYKQALKKSLQEQDSDVSEQDSDMLEQDAEWSLPLEASIQRESFRLAEIFEERKEDKKALDCYRLSWSILGDDNNAALAIPESLAGLLVEALPEYKPLFEKILAINEQQFSVLEEKLLFARVKALLVRIEPDFYCVLTFFTALYFLIEHWYKKLLLFRRLDKSELAELCKLFHAFCFSDLYKQLAGYSWIYREEIEDRLDELDELDEKDEYDLDKDPDESEWREEELFNGNYEDLEDQVRSLDDVEDLMDAFSRLNSRITQGYELLISNVHNLEINPKIALLQQRYHDWFFRADDCFLSRKGLKECEVLLSLWRYAIALLNELKNPEKIVELQRMLFYLGKDIGEEYFRLKDYDKTRFFYEQSLTYLDKSHPDQDELEIETILDLHQRLAKLYQILHENSLYESQKAKIDEIEKEMKQSGGNLLLDSQALDDSNFLADLNVEDFLGDWDLSDLDLDLDDFDLDDFDF